MDVVVKMEEMPRSGETVLGKDLTYIPGGKGANQAFAIGKMDGDVAMLGCVGDDEFGRQQIQNLCQCGVDISGVKRCKDQITGTAVIFVDKEGSNSIVVVPGANRECDIDYIRNHEDMIRACEFVVLQMEVPFETVEYVVRRAKEFGKKVVLNPAPAPAYLEDDFYELLDYITPNETELMKLTGVKSCSIEDMRMGARQLLDKGVGNVLVTLGDKGVMLVNKNIERVFEAKKTLVADTTAAGDCFNGTLVTALAEGMEIEAAICMANLAASIAVSRWGAQTSIPSRSEITELMDRDGRGFL